MGGVAAPGKADDLDFIAQRAQGIYELAVVQVSAAERVERAVDEEAEIQGSSVTFHGSRVI
jgi:hypothetical protein